MKIAGLHAEFSGLVQSSCLGGHLNPVGIGVELVSTRLEPAGHLLNLEAKSNQVGVLVAEQEAAGVGGGRHPNRGPVSRYQSSEHVVQPAPDQVDAISNPLAFRSLPAQVSRQ